MTTTALTSAKTRVHPALGVVMVVISGVLFAVNGTVSKLILEAGVDAQRLTLLRAVGAWAGLLVLSLLVPPGWSRLKVTRAELPLLFTYGITGFFFVPMLYFFAIKLLPVGIALLFEYMAPLLVALWARFGQRQRVKNRLWYGLALSLVGLAFVAEVWKGSLQLNGWGVVAGLAAAVLLCFYYVLGAKGVTQRDTISLTFWAFAVSGAGRADRGGVSGRAAISRSHVFSQHLARRTGVGSGDLSHRGRIDRVLPAGRRGAATPAADQRRDHRHGGAGDRLRGGLGGAQRTPDRRPADRWRAGAGRSRHRGDGPNHGTRRNCRDPTQLTRQDRPHA